MWLSFFTNKTTEPCFSQAMLLCAKSFCLAMYLTPQNTGTKYLEVHPHGLQSFHFLDFTIYEKLDATSAIDLDNDSS